MPEEIIQEKREKTPANLPVPSMMLALLVGLLIIILLVFVFINTKSREEVTPLPEGIPVAQTDATIAPPAESLGGEIYEKTQNPLEDKLPEQTPVANPLGDAYKNPFE